MIRITSITSITSTTSRTIQLYVVMRQLNFLESLDLAVVLVVIGALLALPVAIMVTLALIRLFRKRVWYSMQKTSGITGTPELQEPHFASGPVFGELEIKHIGATRERARAARAAPLIAEARRRERRLAAIYTAAACAHPLILAATMGTFTYVPSQHPVRAFALLYGFFFLQNGTPVALAAAMILTKRLRFLILAVLALITALLVAWKSILGALDPVRVWAMIAGFPTGAVLLLNARRVRAVGPIVFAATLFLFYGIAADKPMGLYTCWM